MVMITPGRAALNTPESALRSSEIRFADCKQHSHEVRNVAEFETQKLQRHSFEADSTSFSAFARSFNIVPPSTPVANTYNHPLLKSNRCE